MFELTKEGNSLRLTNLNDYVELDFSTLDKKSDVLIGFVTFNNPVLATEIALIVSKCGFQVIIIDNHSTESNYNLLANNIKDLSNVKLLRTNTNLGGAGGYALVCEIFLRSHYKHLLLTEDDATPVEADLLEQILNQKNNGDIVSCNYYNNNSESFSFHFTLYSYRLILECGIPDPRFFQGGDDADFLRRQRSILKKNRWTTVRVDRGYHHPTLKGNGTPAKVIRSQRNALLSEIDADLFLPIFARSVAFLAYGFYYLFRGHFYVFRQVFLSWSSIKTMGVNSDIYISNSKLNNSRDAILSFERINISFLKGKLGTSHLRILLAPLCLHKSRNLILTTLDSPWAVIYSPFYSRVTIIKNLSNDIKEVDSAVYNIDLLERFYGLMAIIFASLLSPVFVSIYFIYFKKFFQIKPNTKHKKL